LEQRGALALLDLLKPVCKKLGKKAQLFIADGTDPSFQEQSMSILCL